MMQSLRPSESVITFVLAIYVKAMEIQWREPEEFPDAIIGWGDFILFSNIYPSLAKSNQTLVLKTC